MILNSGSVVCITESIGIHLIDIDSSSFTYFHTSFTKMCGFFCFVLFLSRDILIGNGSMMQAWNHPLPNSSD